MEHTRRLNHTHPAHAHPHPQCIVHLRLHIPARPSTLRMRALGQVHTHTNTHARTHTHTHTGQPSQALAASPAGPPVIAPSPGVWQIALAGRRLRPLINPSFSRAPSADAPRTAARQAQPQGARQDVRPIGLARLEEAVLPPGPQLPRNPRLEEGPRRPRLPPLPLVRLSENCLPPPGTAPSGQPELWDPLVWPAL